MVSRGLRPKIVSLGINRSGRVHVKNAYEGLEDLILDSVGVSCSVLVKPEFVSIRAKDYAEFLLAKSAIAGRVSVPIRRDIEI